MLIVYYSLKLLFDDLEKFLFYLEWIRLSLPLSVCRFRDAAVLSFVWSILEIGEYAEGEEYLDYLFLSGFSEEKLVLSIYRTASRLNFYY